MVHAIELRSAAADYTEAEYQLTKIAAKEVPVDMDTRALFFAEMARCEERVRAAATTFDKLAREWRSSCKELDEGAASTSAACEPDQARRLTTTRDAAAEPCPPSDNAASTRGVTIRGPLLPTGHLRKLVRSQGEIAERSVRKVHKQLDQLVGLVQSHINIKAELPVVHDDIKQMLLDQIRSIKELHAKLDGIAHLLVALDTDPESSGDEDAGSGSGSGSDNDNDNGNDADDAGIMAIDSSGGDEAVSAAADKVPASWK